MKKTAAVTIGLLCSFLSIYAQKTAVTTTFNVLTVQEKREGWKLLFDGKSTIGWHTFNKPVLGPSWEAKDGALHLDSSKKEDWKTKNGGDIVYDKTFKNFHFKIDWKIAKGGNSGIIFYAQEEKKYEYPWYTGFECQVADNQNSEDGRIDKHRAGDLYELIACKRDVVKLAGEWNHLEVLSKNGKLKVVLNGVKVISATLWNANWNQLIAATKFIDMPGFGTFKTGKIALQDHGADVWYRNIMIKELK